MLETLKNKIIFEIQNSSPKSDADKDKITKRGPQNVIYWQWIYKVILTASMVEGYNSEVTDLNPGVSM